jgi:putative membrane protein
MKHLKLLSAATVATAMLAAPTWAASNNSNANPNANANSGGNSGGNSTADGALPQMDRAFLDSAAQGSHMEIAGSKTAQQKSENPAVKAFAEAMIKDHTAMSAEVSTLAASKNHTLPSEPSEEQKAILEELNGLTGQAFDTAYAQRLGIAAHEKTINEFKLAVQDAKDPDVKALAQKTLPKLEHHLEMARELQSDPSMSAK